MKKQLFFAVALAGMMAACSSSDEIAQSGNPDTDYDQIKISATNSTIDTRGKGTVGAVENDANHTGSWNGEKLRIYMTETGTTTVASFKNQDGFDFDGITLFNNAEVNAPTENNGLVSHVDGSISYYPLQGQYDFYGYYCDDATMGEVQNDGAKITYTFIMDGTQDILAGKANFENDKASADEGLSANATAYSGHAARHGVQPTIPFKHLLTRLSFNIAAGDEEAAGTKEGGNTEAMVVKSIKVGTPLSGTLTVVDPAYDGTDPSSLIEWEEADDTYAELIAEDDMKLQMATDENPGTLVKNVDGVDALFVKPGQTEYPLEVVLEQTVKSNIDGTTAVVPLTYKGTVKLDSGEALQVGYSYKVNITLYGLNEIEVKAGLEEWKDGGNASDQNNDTIE